MKGIPTEQELLAWWLFYQLDFVAPGDLTPELVDRLLTTFKQRGNDSIYRELHEQYTEFREQFISPPVNSKVLLRSC